MNREEISHFSSSLNREMHMMIYGHGGKPFLAFPTQNSKCRNYEEFGMIHHIAGYLEEGRMQLFVVDSIDEESWSPKGGDLSQRAVRQEQYYHYIVDEVVPLISERNRSALPITTGCSMGANHAAITFLRRPDLFDGMLALSGVYNTDYFFDGWMDPVLYENAPDRFLPNMSPDHPYISLYNRKKIIFCVGQGAWEEDGVSSLRYLERIFSEKGIHAWCDFWGFDVNHDWPWWYKQMNYFLPIILNS